MTIMDKINAILAKEENQEAALRVLTDKTNSALEGISEIKAMPGLPGEVLDKLNAIEAQFHEMPAPDQPAPEPAPEAAQPAGTEQVSQ